MDAKSERTLLAIDGNSMINREYYGMPPMSSKNGLHTNAVLGFVNKLIKYIDRYSPDYAAVAFDLPEPTFRHLQYPGYKANRKGMPDELAEQLPYVKEACEIFGFSVISETGYEADDILGTMAKKAGETENERIKAYIVTGDKDCFQLASGNVTVLYLANSTLMEFDPEKISEQYGIAPGQLIELKALMGDASDEIPGVKGIGEKTALGLIREFGSIDALYEKLEAGVLQASHATKKKLAEGKNHAYMSRKLAEICRDAPLSPEAFEKRKDTDRTRLYEFCKRLELFSVIKKLNLSAASEQMQLSFGDGTIELP
ncbi:MAG: hypothetical protein FWG34_01950 [Oscillospiraceae bacterium]|nr:hypothetical protein [Oscillospiraceae bacterium]